MTGDGQSHEEIWDDSALLSSWDDALAEYKKYHSLAAKGETVDFRKLEQDQQAESVVDTQQPQPSNEAVNATVEVEQLQSAADAAPTTQPAVAAPNVPVAAASVPVSNAQPGAAAMPQALLNSVQDEGLKNLMMSWYYAGYYTGLLEGQQKAHASMQGGG